MVVVESANGVLLRIIDPAPASLIPSVSFVLLHRVFRLPSAVSTSAQSPSDQSSACKLEANF